jgi:hypothetical protein
MNIAHAHVNNKGKKMLSKITCIKMILECHNTLQFAQLE